MIAALPPWLQFMVAGEGSKVIAPRMVPRTGNSPTPLNEGPNIRAQRATPDGYRVNKNWLNKGTKYFDKDAGIRSQLGLMPPTDIMY